jgi:enamine deaminase RidA (YjgF/YER057c/UK114 family)
MMDAPQPPAANTLRQDIFPLGAKPWPDRYTYVPAVRVGNMLWISGTTGSDENGLITAPGDIVEQTREIFRKFDRLLRAAGGSCDDIVQTVDYYTTTENYTKTAAVRREFFRTARPTSTGVQVVGLLRKDALIEISAVAVLGSAASHA